MEVVDRLLKSEIPSVAYKTRLLLLNESPESAKMRSLRAEIAQSVQAQAILSHLMPDGRMPRVHAYQKWQGPFYSLIQLADLYYPAGDNRLYAMRDQFHDWLFAENHFRMPHTLTIPGQEDRVRRCASQEGFTVWYSCVLGIGNEKTALIAKRINDWQWPDGGWNCDKKPEARKSSVIETFGAVRGLIAYSQTSEGSAYRECAQQAVEFLLRKRIYKRESTGEVILPRFLELNYPYLYHYNFLSGLVIAAEAGRIADERCNDALDLLESKRLPDGGFPLEKSFCKLSGEFVTNGSFVDWVGVGKQRMNPFVTVDALYVLKESGRIKI